MLNRLLKYRRTLTVLIILLLWQYPLFSQPGKLPSVQGANGMVSTAHPLASEAALQVLKNGGNAVDAAIAAAFTIGVVEPDGSGIGGGGSMLIYMKEKNTSYYIDFYQKASEEVNQIDWKRSEGFNAKTILIPGNVAGLVTAIDNFGTVSLDEVLEDAIRYAEQGFPIDNTLATIILDNFELIDRYKSTRNIFMPGGFPLMEGDVLVQKELANTLRVIAEKGIKGFYEGEVAQKISKSVRNAGGMITLNDLKNYKAEITQPLMGNYRGYDIVTANLPQSGVALIETMNMMENINFKELGHYTESSLALHLMSEIFLRSYADRFDVVGDPKYSEIPVNGLLSKDYANARFRQISNDSTSAKGYRKTEPGNPLDYDNSGQTTHISVVDKEGNMVSLTQTLGTFFGSGFSVDGIVFNSSYINFSARIENNKLEPGKTPRSTISPTFLFKDGKPFLCLGTPGGGRIIATLAEIIVNIVDFGMSAESANQAPRFYCQVNDDYLNMEKRISESIRAVLLKKGHNIKVYEDFDLFFGGAQFIIIDRDNNKLYGTADKRRGGVALGY